MKLQCIALMLSMVLLSGCESSPNIETISSLLINQHHTKNFNLFSNIKNVKEVNGFLESNSRYVADISYDLEFTMGLNELEKETDRLYQEIVNAKGPLSSREKIGIKYSLKKEWMPILKEHRTFDRGDTVAKVLQVSLVKKKNGWELDDIRS